MFIKAIKYLLLSLVMLLLIAVALLTYEPVTKALLQKSLSHLLKVDASVEEAKLSIHGLQSSGHLNGDTFILRAKMYTYDSATVTLHYDGDVNTFSSVATVELPHIKTLLDATFSTDTRYLELNASLLKGSLWADLSLERWDYHYRLDALDITDFNSQQKGESNVTYYRPADYFEGQLTTEGKGIIEAPYTVTFHLTGEELFLDKNLTHNISTELETPFPFLLDLNGSVDVNRLKADVALVSPFIETNISNLLYDFNRSAFNLLLSLSNKREDIVPVKAVSLDFNSSIGNELNASYLLTVDDYSINTRHLILDFNTSDITLDYRLSSLQTRPVNLQDENVLFGDISYGNDNLSLKVDSKSINSPTLITLKDNQLHIISNNISLEALQDIGNQEVIAKGGLFVEVDANLSSKPPLWSSKLQSKDLKLPWKYRKDIGLKNSLNLTLKAYNTLDGEIVIRPTLWSNIGMLNYSALRYKPRQGLLFFNLNVKKLKTSYYRSPKLNVRGSINLKKERLNKTRIIGSYDNMVIQPLYYAKKTFNSDIELKISRLDRFAHLNPNYTLKALLSLQHYQKKTHITLETEQLGTLQVDQKNSVIKVTGKELPFEAVDTLTNQPRLLQGDLQYTVYYNGTTIEANITSEKINGYGDLNRSIRPFALHFASKLHHDKEHYRGSATLKTDNETFKITDIDLDPVQKKLVSHYQLDIAALEKNSIILPQELKGPLHLHGDFEQNKYQYLSFYLVDFQLPTTWHQMLDKNATLPLETNVTVQLYNDKGIIDLSGTIDNTLLDLTLHKGRYDIRKGDFDLHARLKTRRWLKTTQFDLRGNYNKQRLNIAPADIATQYYQATIDTLNYRFDDQDLSLHYQLNIQPYEGAPYHSDARIYGDLHTKPALSATMRSDSLGGTFEANVTQNDLHVIAHDVSMPKLLAFSGEKTPISAGTLDAKIDLYAPNLPDMNLSTFHGRSDINISQMLLEGVRLDKQLKTLRESQDLNLFQGSFSELPIVRSVKEIPSNLSKEKSNETSFGTIHLLTDINATGLHCSDCAITTEENLIALKGGINLDNMMFDDFYVGLLLPNNCAYFIQQIEGNVTEPKVQLAAAGFHVVGGAAKSLIGNVGTVLDFGAGVIKGTGHVVGGAASHVPIVGKKTDKALTTVTDVPKDGTSSMTSCIPFYTGRVQHPKNLLSTD